MEMSKGAVISDCGRYRYSLSRTWDPNKPVVLFVMLNPSTADAEVDDPTIRRCIGFAKSWEYGGIRVVNLYAWRATKPADLKLADDPVGRLNDAYIRMASYTADRVIAAWGANPGPVPGRAEAVLGMLGMSVEALGETKDGSPKHPLYVRADTIPIFLLKETLWQDFN